MKCILYALAALLTACSQAPQQPLELSQLKKQKYTIDSAINAGKLLVFMKEKHKPGLIPLTSGVSQKNREAGYNVFKDQSGNVVYIAEMPFSPADDYFIAYKNYFDTSGKLIAFERINNFFGSECAERAALEDLLKFYNKDFKVIDSTYTLTDSKKNKLEKAKCKFPYDFPYAISRNLEEYKKARGIKEL